MSDTVYRVSRTGSDGFWGWFAMDSKLFKSPESAVKHALDRRNERLVYRLVSVTGADGREIGTSEGEIVAALKRGMLVTLSWEFLSPNAEGWEPSVTGMEIVPEVVEG